MATGKKLPQPTLVRVQWDASTEAWRIDQPGPGRSAYFSPNAELKVGHLRVLERALRVRLTERNLKELQELYADRGKTYSDAN